MKNMCNPNTIGFNKKDFTHINLIYFISQLWLNIQCGKSNIGWYGENI